MVYFGGLETKDGVRDDFPCKGGHCPMVSTVHIR